MRWLVVFLLFTGPAAADGREEAIKKAIFRLSLAFHCTPVLKDDGPYAWAKSDAVNLVGNAEADKMVAYVENRPWTGAPLNEKFCRIWTKNFKS